jgi:hypothetical protein
MNNNNIGQLQMSVNALVGFPEICLIWQRVGLQVELIQTFTVSLFGELNWVCMGISGSQADGAYEDVVHGIVFQILDQRCLLTQARPAETELPDLEKELSHMSAK